jgi:tetratricopeptide (TPR) repeat protein
VDTPDETIGQLRDRLLRVRADRQPVEHATAQFDLGAALLRAGKPVEAERALAVATTLFDDHGHAFEGATALNLLGAAWRDLGALTEAGDAFDHAAGFFAQGGHRRHEAAARYNLGLARRDGGNFVAAIAAFGQAEQLFAETQALGQASAACRERGAALLAAGGADEAVEPLRRAVTLAKEAKDVPALGSAANALGLAYLAEGRVDEAIAAFTDAVASNPRGVRPHAYAMARANLALAYEQAGEAPRARLAARQARRTPDAPGAVMAQADAMLARLGDPPGDVVAVLDDTPVDGWPRVLRAELLRWLDEAPEARSAEAAAWVDVLEARGGQAPELAEAWFGVVLELAPDAMETLLGTLLDAVAERDAAAAERVRGSVARALPRFHPPQWFRLKDALNRLAEDRGQEAAWG